MVAEKEKEYLIFHLDDGSTVKYNLATKETIGKTGRVVKNLKSQLQGYSIKEVCDSFQDSPYGRFLQFVKNGQLYEIFNVGTLLERAAGMARFEQLFTAGLTSISSKYKYSITDTPKGLVSICRNYNVGLNNEVHDIYLQNPSWFHLAVSMQFETLTPKKAIDALVLRQPWPSAPYFEKLCKDYGYTCKPLFLYIDHLMTYEALEDLCFILNELVDYAVMMKKISGKFDKYPRNFLTTHKIATRNYNRLKHVFDEAEFQERRDPSLACRIGDYQFIYPKNTQEIKDEAVRQNNCVASYIQRVLDGTCHILFMRKVNTPDESLITIEVRNNQIVQALRRFNYPISEQEREVVELWNKKYKEKDVQIAC